MYFSIKYFIWSILVIILVIFFRLNPMNIDEQPQFKSEDVPQFSFHDFLFFDLDSQVVTTILRGKYGEGFDNGFLRMRDMYLIYQNKKYRESIKADYSFYNEEAIDMKNNIIYKRSDGLILKTENISYDIENKYFYIPEKFQIKQQENTVEGKSLVIDRKTGNIHAFNINAVLDGKTFEY